LAESNLHWFALQTKTQYERIAAEALRGKGYEEFVPLFRRRALFSGRIREVDEPMFPGYVFSRFDAEYRLPILTTPYVRSVVGIGKAPLPVEDHEIESLQSVMRSGLPARPWPFLKVGQWVRIGQGSLDGVEGLLLEVRDHYRIVVSIGLLQRSVAVEIDEAWLKPVPRPVAASWAAHAARAPRLTGPRSLAGSFSAGRAK
jgi:transcription antitermination factor NusG